VARFREAARGTGAVPWHLDLDHEEARIFAPMAAGGAEARMLARQIREVLAARHDRILAHWAERGSCPFDLHWLRTHWGTSRMPRGVRIREEGADRRLRRKAEIVYEFRSADWTPWQAILRLRGDWPRLLFTVRPRYDEG
jgi:hypothetical protein